MPGAAGAEHWINNTAPAHTLIVLAFFFCFLFDSSSFCHFPKAVAWPPRPWLNSPPFNWRWKYAMPAEFSPGPPCLCTSLVKSFCTVPLRSLKQRHWPSGSTGFFPSCVREKKVVPGRVLDTVHVLRPLTHGTCIVTARRDVPSGAVTPDHDWFPSFCF